LTKKLIETETEMNFKTEISLVTGLRWVIGSNCGMEYDIWQNSVFKFLLGMWRSQSISAFVGCGFHVQNPSDSDADLLRDQNYQLF